MTGIEHIAKERQEQIEKHGRTVEQDVELNDEQQLKDASMILLLQSEEWDEDEIPKGWDYKIWKHIIGKSEIERLTIAGAFIAAEIDRIQYLETNKQQ